MHDPNFLFLCFLFVWRAAELQSCRAFGLRPPPMRDCTVALEVTLHIPPPSPPETWAPSLTYQPHWNLIHPSARCINNPLYTQGFFFNKPSCETNLLSICPVREGLEIKFPFWGILSPAELEIKLHSVLFFFHGDMYETWAFSKRRKHTETLCSHCGTWADRKLRG